ncbi:Cytochrome c oxidase subunit 6B2 [Eumeta japonica]|uniref:Cytochrome c oxidase subunit 6B2 n=1 Tax=Eumeta variegata TaxID=151549 RepID=A0A4C1SYU5_EUMVA|nr:Cytochrome c oxidase subunit 6B2 [Eumeta japonica]
MASVQEENEINDNLEDLPLPKQNLKKCTNLMIMNQLIELVFTGKWRKVTRHFGERGQSLSTTETGGITPGEPEMTIKLETVPFDPRFPNQNQTRHCYQSYLDYFAARRNVERIYEPCNYFKKAFHSLCPNAWIESGMINEQMALSPAEFKLF